MDRPPLRIAVASPCTKDWNQMEGDEKKRFCAGCRQHVYDLSQLRYDEVRALLDAEAPPCVRFFQRADGTVMTKDCPVGRERKRRPWRKMARLALAACAAWLLARASLPRTMCGPPTTLWDVARRGARALLPREGCDPPPEKPPIDAGAWVRALHNVPPPPPPDESWMEQRRAQLPPRAPTLTMGRPRALMGTIQVIRQGK